MFATRTSGFRSRLFDYVELVSTATLLALVFSIVQRPQHNLDVSLQLVEIALIAFEALKALSLRIPADSMLKALSLRTPAGSTSIESARMHKLRALSASNAMSAIFTS